MSLKENQQKRKNETSDAHMVGYLMSLAGRGKGKKLLRITSRGRVSYTCSMTNTLKYNFPFRYAEQ